MLAAVACGEYPSVEEAARKLVNVTGREVPDPDLTARYEERYQAFRRIYPALKDVFPALNG